LAGEEARALCDAPPPQNSTLPACAGRGAGMGMAAAAAVLLSSGRPLSCRTSAQVAGCSHGEHLCRVRARTVCRVKR